MDIVKNRMMFLAWLRSQFPVIYTEAMRRTMATDGVPLAGLGDFDSWSNSFSNLLNNVSNVATQYLTTRAQVDLVQNNISRINSGAPPLNASGRVMTDAEMRAAGYSDSTIAQIEAQMSRSGSFGFGAGGIPSWALFGALGLGAFMILRRK